MSSDFFGSGWKTDTSGSKCKVCGDDIVVRSYIPYKPQISANIIGPGSANIATEDDRQVLGMHCDGCGIVYYKLPKTT